MKMMLLLGGVTRAEMGLPMMIFKKHSWSYPIRGVHDTFPGACYLSGPKGWMDLRCFASWLSVNVTFKKLQKNRRRFLLLIMHLFMRLLKFSRKRLRRVTLRYQCFPRTPRNFSSQQNSSKSKKIVLHGVLCGTQSVWKYAWWAKLSGRIGSGAKENYEILERGSF